MNYDVFISYRRKNPDGISNISLARTFLLKFESLGYKVFFDYSECTDDYFVDKILPAIRTCRFFLLIMTPGALERCKIDEGDWVRREIEEALKYQRKIIPVTPDDNSQDVWPMDLPQSLSLLSANGGLQITKIHMGSFFDVCIGKLIEDRMGPSSKAYRDEENIQEENEKTKLTIVEAREKIASLREISGLFSATLKEMAELEPHLDLSKGEAGLDEARLQIIASNAFALDKITEVGPILNRADRDMLLGRNKDIEKRRGKLQEMMISSGGMTKTDTKLIRDLIKDEIELKHDFKKVLEKEIAKMSDSIRVLIETYLM